MECKSDMFVQLHQHMHGFQVVNGFSKAWMDRFDDCDFHVSKETANKSILCKADETRKLVATNLQKGHHWVAVCDESNPKYAYIGEFQFISSTRYSLLGMFVSFKRDGSILQRELAPELSDIDDRDGIPKNTEDFKNIFYCNRHLFFVSHERSMRDWNVEIVSFKTRWFFRTKYRDFLHETVEIIDNRWMCFHLDMQMLCIDMRSFANALTGEIYQVLLSKDAWQKQLLQLKVPNYEPVTSQHGYPLVCAKCNEKTVVGTFCIEQPFAMKKTFPVGEGWCPLCGIRFAKSAQAYQCTQLKPLTETSFDLCEETLKAPHFTCTSKHASNEVYKVNLIETEGDEQMKVRKVVKLVDNKT